MGHDLQRLFPPSPSREPLPGLYLRQPLRPEGHEGLFIYSNFVTSLDGRIAIGEGMGQVPDTIANERDWRLFQELAARADILLTSGRYLRQFSDGTAQSPLPLSPAQPFADLHQWRAEQELPAQPDVAVISATLEFHVPQGLLSQGRRVIILTGRQASDETIRARTEEGAEVRQLACDRLVDGQSLFAALTAEGYRNAYCIAGAYVLHTLLAAGRIDTLFLTTVNRMIGGAPFSSLVTGSRLEPPADFRLRWLYHDPEGPGRAEQLYARYDRVTA